MKKKKAEDSYDSVEVVPAVEEEELSEKKQKQSFIKKISGVMETATNVGNIATEIYNEWIKPIRENWQQIKRRLSLISTIISIVFFLLYVPFLLVNKIGKDLALGYDVALYVCISIYLVTLAALLIVTLASGKSNTVAMEKRRKMISRIILMVVRLASLAMGITALIISAMESTVEQASAVGDTVAIIFAVMSIIFSAFPLLFGSIGGFVKWLISPAKIKFRFSFVALEWLQTFTEEQQIERNMKRAARRYGERAGWCLDTYFLPALGDKYIKSIDANAITKMLQTVPEEDKNMCEWMTKRIFEHAEDCKYVENNPCEKLALEGDILMENKAKNSQSQDAGKGFFSLFRRKKVDEAAPADDTDEN